MTVITPGTGGTMKSTTGEALLAEVIDFIQLAESNSVRNPNVRDYVRANYNCNSYLLEASFTFSYTEALSTTTGEMFISLPDYLTGTNFVPGTNGTFKSSNVCAYCFEVAKYLDIAERDATKNPTNQNRITITQNAEALVATGTISLPFTLTQNSTGTRTIAITPYLS